MDGFLGGIGFSQPIYRIRILSEYWYTMAAFAYLPCQNNWAMQISMTNITHLLY